AFQSTHVFQNHGTLLGNNHWIWADSAYPLEPWCIPPFKKPPNGALTSNQKSFNTTLSRVRVQVEHTFAALKGRFQSLQELRHPMQNENDLQYISYWVICCVILHNMIIRFEEHQGIFGGTGSTNGWALRNQGANLISSPEPE
ncbi:hypothetical protein BDR05DRAFT_860535, partial [Suillus weaverae]